MDGTISMEAVTLIFYSFLYFYWKSSNFYEFVKIIQLLEIWKTPFYWKVFVPLSTDDFTETITGCCLMASPVKHWNNWIAVYSVNLKQWKTAYSEVYPRYYHSLLDKCKNKLTIKYIGRLKQGVTIEGSSNFILFLIFQLEITKFL